MPKSHSVRISIHPIGCMFWMLLVFVLVSFLKWVF